MIPVIDKAAEAGCEYYCMDAGWCGRHMVGIRLENGSRRKTVSKRNKKHF